jgi:hypothetical protein
MNNADYIRRYKNILALKEKRLCDAARNRDLQIKNIYQLYDFEIQNIESLHKAYFFKKSII